MKKFICLFLTSLLCFHYSTSPAQENSFFLQQHINCENGLPQNSIRDALFSPSGYLWLATEDGLVRFDGSKTMVFSSLNSELKYNRIYKFLYTNTGKFYCITEDDLIFDIIESPTGVQIKYTGLKLKNEKLEFTVYDNVNTIKAF